jgi:hypothetical protein
LSRGLQVLVCRTSTFANLAISQNASPPAVRHRRQYDQINVRHLGSSRSVDRRQGKLIKIGAKVVSHGRYIVFQMAKVAIPRQMIQEILRLIAELRLLPPSAPA